MNFHNLFRRHCKGGIVEATSGITTSDWMTVYNKIKREYNATAEAHKRPTEYMRGLAFALDILDSIRPYNIAEVK